MGGVTLVTDVTDYLTALIMGKNYVLLNSIVFPRVSNSKETRHIRHTCHTVAGSPPKDRRNTSWEKLAYTDLSTSFST